MKFSRESLQQIRERIDMVELVGSYTKLERRGDRWWGLSPFKAEKTASFTVKPDEGFYYCFATSRGGDLFKFVSEMEGLSFPEAVRFLADRAGVPLDDTPADPAEGQRRSLYELYSRVAGTFAWLLQEDPRGTVALNYAQQRGITPSSQKQFQLGYTPDSGRWLYQFLRQKDYSNDFLRNSGLFSRRSEEFSLFRHRLMFPIQDERGRVVAFGGRSLREEDRAKYINSPETIIYQKKSVLYGLHQSLEAIRSSRSVFIAEGYLDVIAIHEAGIPAAVAPLGTAFTDEQARLLRRWVDEIVLVFDGDSAGFQATVRAASIAETTGLRCKVVMLQAGADPADMLQREGSAAVRELLSTPVSAWEFILKHAQRQFPVDDPQQRELLLRNVLPYIRIVNSEVRREAMLEQVADITGVSLAAVQRDYSHWRGGEVPEKRNGIETPAAVQNRTRDFTLVLACLQAGELFSYLRNNLAHTDLSDPVARTLFLVAEDSFRHEETFPRGVIDRIADETLRNRVLEFITSGECTGWSVSDVRDAVRRLQVEKLLREERDVVRAMKDLTSDDVAGLRRLQEKKMALDQEIRDLKARVDDRTEK